MELKAIRVQNYKKIQDTGWIDCDRLTVFVGKNESGKTALFRGLSKLKPTDGLKYDPIKEFPHGRYTDEFSKQDWPVASAMYELNKQKREQLSEISGLLDKTKTVSVTKYYSDKFTVQYQPEPKIEPVSPVEWLKTISKIKKDVDDSVAPDGQGDNWKPQKDAISSFLSKQMAQIQQSGYVVSLQNIDAVRQNLSSHMNEAWMKEIIQPQLDLIDEQKNIVSQYEKLAEADQWIYDNIPFFLYFGNYEVLNSAIYLPEFISRVNSGSKAPLTRVQAALFKHVGVDITELANLGKHDPAQGKEDAAIRKQIDELDIKANSASIAMTRKFTDWWEQRRHKFTYKFHGNYFRVWISDDLDPADVELEERSLGFQYFFSFYLLFLVEAEEEHRDCVLLLDEPGNHLHGTAQLKLISFLEKISQKNQTYYTTHSPFMIDGNHLEKARAVYETPEGTKVTSDVWPRDKDTLFPLQAALGYSVCQSLFISAKQIMVEGMTDYTLLTVINQQLQKQGKGLDKRIILIPMGGTTNLAPLASMLIGNQVQIGILLDSDPAGIGSMKKIKHHLADIDERCVLVGNISGNPDARELEDLIPEKYYMDAFTRAYPDVKISFNKEESQIASIVDRISAFSKRTDSGDFEKWRPIQEIVQDINSNSTKVPPELYAIADTIFGKFNQILGDKK